MAVRIYVIPTTSPIFNGKPWRCVKYLGDTWLAARIDASFAPEVGLENIQSSRHYYGANPVAIVIADVTPAQNTILSGKPDVLTVPANMDDDLSAGAVSTTQNFLESLHIPAGWVSTALTYRAVIRKILWLFMYVQAVQGLYNVPLVDSGTGITQSSTFERLPQAQQDAMTQAVNLLGFSTAGLQPSTTLRTLLKNLADQWGDVPFESLGFNV